MQALLGLFFFSVLVTQAFSLQCETCNVEAKTCTAKNETCSPNLDGCFTLLLETKEKTPVLLKGCMEKAKCQKLKGEKGKVAGPEYGSYPKESVVQDVDCSKAPISSASLWLILSGLLLMKFLF